MKHGRQRVLPASQRRVNHSVERYRLCTLRSPRIRKISSVQTCLDDGHFLRAMSTHSSPWSVVLVSESDLKNPTTLATKSRKHSIFTHHFPKARNCEVCLRTKMTRAPCRRRTGEAPLRAEKFGDLITVDHKSPE